MAAWTKTTTRTARKEHKCGGCKNPISPGTRYIETTTTGGRTTTTVRNHMTH